LVLALLVVVAALVGLVVWLRQRATHRSWNASFDAAVQQSMELSRDVAPSLLAGSPESRRGGWEMARPRVVELEDHLQSLARAASDETPAAAASELGLAVGDVRRGLDDVVGAVGPRAEAAVAVAHDACRRLEQRLATLAAPSRGDPRRGAAAR
jgi:hypothetical protein